VTASLQSPQLGLQAGDHICAFYNGGGSGDLDDIVVDFISKGLRAKHKCIGFIDKHAPVQARISPELLSRENMLQLYTEEQGYLPTGDFSTEAFIEALDATARSVFADGYERLWLIGDTSVVIRNGVDPKAWFAAEAQVSELAPRYPQFIMCLYDLDLYDGDMVMYVLKTHTRIFVNGLIIDNPYYVPKQQFLSEL
jgi:MEDS: MEthanogen/methylotroph, DcmR Sensory domain